MNKRCVFCVLAVLFYTGAVFAQDYGLVLRSLPVCIGGDESSANLEYTAGAIPWFASSLGERGDLYLSGGISAEYADKKWKPVPELYRFEIAWRFDSGMRLEAGRLLCGEPLKLVMNGLFDGFKFGFNLGKTRFGAGVFYSGLLYKKTARITMSPGDYADYYGGDQYFASRRLLGALNWEIPSLFNTEAKLELGLIGQFDLNESGDTTGDYKIHSQYALAKYTLPFLNYFNAELGGLLGMIEEEGLEPGFCFAASGAIAWLPEGGLHDRLSLNMILSSGMQNHTARAFLPVTTIAMGKVLRPKISGLALAEAGYTVRLHQAFSANAWAGYFFRTDSYSYVEPDLDKASLSPLLGGEVSGGLGWAPVSDLSFTLAGGVFFPQSGKVFANNAPLRWRVSLETILSF